MSAPINIGESVVAVPGSTYVFDAAANVQYRASLSLPAGVSLPSALLRVYRGDDPVAIRTNKAGQSYVDFSPYDKKLNFEGGPASVAVVALPAGLGSYSPTLTITQRNAFIKIFGGVFAWLKSFVS